MQRDTISQRFGLRAPIVVRFSGKTDTPDNMPACTQSASNKPAMLSRGCGEVPQISGVRATSDATNSKCSSRAWQWYLRHRRSSNPSLVKPIPANLGLPPCNKIWINVESSRIDSLSDPVFKTSSEIRPRLDLKSNCGWHHSKPDRPRMSPTKHRLVRGTVSARQLSTSCWTLTPET